MKTLFHPRALILLAFGLAACNRPAAPQRTIVADTTPLPPPSLHTYLTVNLDSTVPPHDTTSTFGVSDTIHGIIQTENAKEGSSLLGRWYALKNGDKIAENGTRLSLGPNLSHFDLINESQWLPGQYKLVVMLDGIPKDSAVFTVKQKK